MNRAMISLTAGALLASCLLAADSVASGTTDAKPPQLSPHQESLLMQLADAEANIQAINKALKVTGYNVGVAYDQIDSQLKGNELMNRNGGGPVRWDKFYGKTAREYGSNNWGDKQPDQFKFVYKANNDRVARAKEQIAALARNQAALLERRRKHEADQTRLWATLAFERIKDREIGFEPACRFELKSVATPPDKRPATLRPFVAFLEAVDKSAAGALQSVESNPNGTFVAMSGYLDAAYVALQGSCAELRNQANLSPDDQKRVDSLKELCKQLAEECKVVAENEANALDRDRANEDNSKLQFRAALQDSLARFASDGTRLDEEVNATMAAWSIAADPQRPSVGGPAAFPGSQGPSLTGDPTAASRTLKLFEPPYAGKWTRKGQPGLQPGSDGSVRLNNTSFRFQDISARNVVIRARVHKLSGQNLFLNLRTGDGSNVGVWFNGGNWFGITAYESGKPRDLVNIHKGRALSGEFSMEFSAIGDTLVLRADGEEIARAQTKIVQAGGFGIGAGRGESVFRDVEVTILDNPIGSEKRP